MLSNSLIILVQITTLYLAGSGMGIDIFVQTSFPALFISLLLFGWAMTTAAFLITTICKFNMILKISVHV
jgi:hypothetical protein